MVEIILQAQKMVIKPSFSITSGDGYGFKSISKDYGGLKYGGRIVFLPFGLFRNFGQFRQVDMVERTYTKTFNRVSMVVITWE